MSIGEAASPCPQIWIAEKTFTDFFLFFNKQSFSVLGGTTTSPNWFEEMVWGKEKGKRHKVAVYAKKRKSHSTHPTHEKKENGTYFVQLIVEENDMCGSGMCLYTIDRSVNRIVSFVSLSLCFQSVIESMKKIVQADKNDRFSVFLILLPELPTVPHLGVQYPI